MAAKSNHPVLEVINSAKKPTSRKTGNTSSGGGNGSSKALSFGDYKIVNGSFYQVKAAR